MDLAVSKQEPVEQVILQFILTQLQCHHAFPEVHNKVVTGTGSHQPAT